MAGSLFKKSGMIGRQQRYQPMADINVTPFVDVMLVLLIVFMVTAPLMTVGVPIDLPKTKAAEINDSDEPLVITLNKDGVIFIQESKIELESLTARLMAIAGNNSDIRIFIRGDKNLEYGTVMQVMGQITSSGFKKVALLAKLPEQNN